jgi:hypothetical protein
MAFVARATQSGTNLAASRVERRRRASDAMIGDSEVLHIDDLGGAEVGNFLRRHAAASNWDLNN